VAAIGARSPTVAEAKPVEAWIIAPWRNLSEVTKNVLETYYKLFHAPGHCPECGEYCIVKCIIRGDVDGWHHGSDRGVDYGHKVAVLRVSPVGATSLSPEVPSDIAEVLQELEEDLLRGRNEGRILAGCRSVLDVALQRLGETTGTRGERIGRLGANGTLTAGLAEWARRLWQDGHDGVHELKAAGHPVVEHVAFLKLFVEVAFVIPKKISEGQV
jgi:hypothetical protein